MILLVLGCILFLASHLVSFARVGIEARVGHNGYMGLITLGSILSIVMIVFGYRQMEASALWAPMASSYQLTLYLMPIAAILLVAGNMPCNISRIVPHSMLTGIILWAALHLLSNGDVASTIIFVTFGGYAIYRRFTLAPKVMVQKPVYMDALTVFIGLAVYAGMLRFHETLSGVPIAY